MNLISKLYQREVVDRIKDIDWFDYSKSISPFIVELDPTAVCDLACPGCISADVIAEKNSFNNDRLISLTHEMIEFGVKGIILIGGGEPLAHPKSGEVIRICGENDVSIGITTNGSFVHRFIDEISEFSNWTRFSMDAGSNEMFSILRPTKSGRSKFDKIISNMNLLSKTKKGKMGYSFLIQTKADGIGIESNIKEIYNAAVIAKDSGCDYFEVKPTYEYRNGVNHALMKHEQYLMDEAREEILRLDDLEDENFSVIQAINLEASLSGIQEIQIQEYKKCPSTYLRTLVTPSGLFVCPYWRGKDKMNLGSVKENSFAEVWQGKQRSDVMNRLNATIDCNFHCLRNATNNTIHEISKKISQGDKLDTCETFDRFI